MRDYENRYMSAKSDLLSLVCSCVVGFVIGVIFSVFLFSFSAKQVVIPDLFTVGSFGLAMSCLACTWSKLPTPGGIIAAILTYIVAAIIGLVIGPVLLISTIIRVLYYGRMVRKERYSELRVPN